MNALKKLTKDTSPITMEDIIREGHPTLRSVAKEVDLPLTQEDKLLAQKMLTFLKNSQDPEIAEEMGLRGGVGLAATQLDVKRRMIALHIPHVEEDEEGNLIEGEPEFSAVLINPKIIAHSVQEACLGGGEGCLSVDREVEGYVVRYAKVTITYFDETGEGQRVKLKGYPAIVLQHEVDHLNGVMFYDHINAENPFALKEGVLVLE